MEALKEFIKVFIIILTPTLFIYGAVETINGWRLIKHTNFSHHPTYIIIIWLYRHFAGVQKSEEYQKRLEQNANYISTRGYYSFFGGFLYLAMSIMFILLLRYLP